MDFFDTLTNKSKDVVDKAKKLAEITSLNSQVSSKESEIQKVYYQIGKVIYENKAAWKDVDLSGLIGSIDTLQTDIEHLKLDILLAKGLKPCAKCGAEINSTAAFCPNCGAKASQTEETTEEIVVEATEVVVTATESTESIEAVAEKVVEEQPASDGNAAE